MDDDGDFGVCCTQIGKNLQAGITLLDNQSTHSIFRTKDKLKNIRLCNNGGLTMRSSGGGQFHTKLVGDYTRLGMTVWFVKKQWPTSWRCVMWRRSFGLRWIRL